MASYHSYDSDYYSPDQDLSPSVPCPCQQKQHQQYGTDLQNAVEKMVKLNQENFDLRLHCYHLKEKLDRLGQSQTGSPELLDSSHLVYWEEKTSQLRREMRDQADKIKEMALERQALMMDNSQLREALHQWELPGDLQSAAPSSSTPASNLRGTGSRSSNSGGGVGGSSVGTTAGQESSAANQTGTPTGSSGQPLSLRRLGDLCRARDGDLLASDADLAAIWGSSSTMGATVWLGLTATAGNGYRWLSGARPFGLDHRVYWERDGKISTPAVPAPEAVSGCASMYTFNGLRVLLAQANCSTFQPVIDGLLCRYDPVSERNRNRLARLVDFKFSASASADLVAVPDGAISRIECLARCSAKSVCRIAHHLATVSSGPRIGDGSCYLGYYNFLPRPFAAVGWSSAVFF